MPDITRIIHGADDKLCGIGNIVKVLGDKAGQRA
jgi:hypothetical protein